MSTTTNTGTRASQPYRRLAGDELERHAGRVQAILAEVDRPGTLTHRQFNRILRRHPRDGSAIFSKNQLVQIYRHLCETGRMAFDEALLRKIQVKPVRTISGVTPVTVLTKPFPCPGACIFCPDDERMPKSYLHNEPAAMRAELNAFDPHEQVSRRIRAFAVNGHATDKVELLVLGGSWSSYERDYQECFLRRCLEAMNGSTAPTLEEAQDRNETAEHRQVGLVVETRPDQITPEEIRWLRRLGVTKVQIGAQSLDDSILAKNHRGHSVEQTRRAMTLLRAAGFKQVLHWMPNLLGATPERDFQDFQRLWEDESLRPDELKIYSTVLLENTELHRYWQSGEFKPYPEDELIGLLIRCKELVPRYCRINRLFRDIPGTDIVAGSKMSNMRQQIQRLMKETGRRCACIRCREVRGESFAALDDSPDDLAYRTRETEEHFLSIGDDGGRLAGYVRLTLPDHPGGGCGSDLGIDELRDGAIIREVHVYGPSLELGQSSERHAQHQGLGTRLLQTAEEIARRAGFARMVVISAVGTRPYYAHRGYERAGTYMAKQL